MFTVIRMDDIEAKEKLYELYKKIINDNETFISRIDEILTLLNSNTPAQPTPSVQPEEPNIPLQEQIDKNDYVLIDGVYDVGSPLKLHSNMTIEFRQGELIATEVMSAVLDGRECVNVTIKGEGKIQALGKAAIGVDFSFMDQIVTHNKIYDLKVFGATDVGIDFTNNSEFLLSGQWEVNGAAFWAGVSPMRYSDYGLRVKNSGGQNTITGGSIQGCKKGDIYISGGTLKIFGGAFLTSYIPEHETSKDVKGNIVIEGNNAGISLYMYGSWFENNKRPNIFVNTTMFDIGVIDLYGVQMQNNGTPNIVGIKQMPTFKGIGYFNVFGGYMVSASPDPEYQIDAYIWVAAVYLGGSGNATKGFLNTDKVATIRHQV